MGDRTVIRIAAPSGDAIRSSVLLVAVLFPAGALLIALGWQFDWWKKDGLLSQWQTLVSGLLAIVAAGIGAAFVHAQIRLAERHEQERVARRFDACRAVLPLTLSALCSYGRDCAAFLLPIYNQREGSSIPTGIEHRGVPIVDGSITTGLREMVEASPVEVRTEIATLLGELQVLRARIEDLPRSILSQSHLVTASNIEAYISDAARVYARAIGMFDFARREVDEIEVKIDVPAVTSALRQMDVYDVAYPRVHLHIIYTLGDVEERRLAAIELSGLS